jgi:S1-C subfamily serine protease
MQRSLRLSAAVGLAAWPIVLLAQEPPEAPRAPRAPRVARAPRAPRAPRAFAFAFDDNRGRVGVIVRTDANAETDKIGAKIEAVTPGGPADKAGLKVGDVISKFNGTALAGAPSDDEEESGPGKKLIALARKLEPGDTVQVEFRRGTEVKKATLVAEDLGSSRFRVHWPEPGVLAMPRMPDVSDMHFDFFESPWGDLRLVSLNPDLGEYFGTKEGVLVVKAPADSSLPLKSGDVILAIGGRKPGSPEHAMRILRSYDKGETVAIDIMRRQKRLSVAWKVPSREDRSLLGEPREEPSRWWRRPLRHRSRLQRA